VPDFSVLERSHLQAFLNAARQIGEASVVVENKSLSWQGSVGEDGALEQSYQLFENEPFRSLAMSVRLVYMNEEPANFGHVCNILHVNGDQGLKEAASSFRLAYNGTLNGSMMKFGLHGDFEGRTVGPREVFEIWLYGDTFHQDQKLEAILAELRKFGDSFTLALNLFVMRLVDIILQLASLVMKVLGDEEPADGV
jgi:hypothetical protein